MTRNKIELIMSQPSTLQGQTFGMCDLQKMVIRSACRYLEGEKKQFQITVYFEKLDICIGLYSMVMSMNDNNEMARAKSEESMDAISLFSWYMHCKNFDLSFPLSGGLCSGTHLPTPNIYSNRESKPTQISSPRLAEYQGSPQSKLQGLSHAVTFKECVVS